LAVSTPQPALNVRLLGSDFAKPSDGEVVSKQLYRLAAVFGDPWGKNAAMLQQMANEWLEALSDLPAATVERGISEWVKTGDKWPKPSDIRKAAERQVYARVARVSEERHVHERRLKPTEAMLAFHYESSLLRKNLNWDRYLDTVHPTLEHNFFVKARLGEYEHIVFLENEFCAEWVARNCSDALERHFGRRVAVLVDGAPDTRKASSGRVDREADAAGLRSISAIAAKFGGFNPGDTGSMAAIYNSPEYQAYLKDYTARTGLAPG
jgi:hypothetical protein